MARCFRTRRGRRCGSEDVDESYRFFDHSTLAGREGSRGSSPYAGPGWIASGFASRSDATGNDGSAGNSATAASDAATPERAEDESSSSDCSLGSWRKGAGIYLDANVVVD